MFAEFHRVEGAAIDRSGCFDMTLLQMGDGEGLEHHAVTKGLNRILGEADPVAEDPTALYANTIRHPSFKVQYGIGSWL